jgi:Cu2+-exporting ATPase
VILLSGDTRGAVEAFATRIGIEEVIAEALPQEKAALVADLVRDGAKVLMVGDGLNDTAALAAAHVSISPASALDAARTASDMVLMGRSLAPIADATRPPHRRRGASARTSPSPRSTTFWPCRWPSRGSPRR